MVDFRARSGKIENESRRLCCKRIRMYLKYDKVGILLSNFFFKWITDTCNVMDEPQKHAEWIKPDT